MIMAKNSTAGRASASSIRLPRSTTERIVALFVIAVGLFALWPLNHFSRGNDPCEVAEKNDLNNVDSKLPKIIHHQWRTDPITEEPHRSWYLKKLALFPDHQHIIWTDDKIRRFLQEKHAWFLPQFDGYKQNISRVDAARYFILYEYGGLYMDMDYEPLVNFWAQLPDDKPAVVQSPFYCFEQTQNSFMSSPAKHPFWNVLIQVLMQPERANSRNPLYAAGPQALDEAVVSFFGGAYILPCENWNRANLMSSFHFLRHLSPCVSYFIRPCGNIHDNKCQYGIHHGASVYASV